MVKAEPVNYFNIFMFEKIWDCDLAAEPINNGDKLGNPVGDFISTSAWELFLHLYDRELEKKLQEPASKGHPVVC